MFVYRDLGRSSLVFCGMLAALINGACTKSHDVEASALSLSAGSGAMPAGNAGASGRSASAGSTNLPSAGSSGSAGQTGGGPCGATCTDGTLLGFLPITHCCTTTNKCGLDVSSLGLTGCAEKNAAGTADPSCPGTTVSGVMLEGCCRADGTCGSLDTFLGLGCAVETGGLAVKRCTPK